MKRALESFATAIVLCLIAFAVACSQPGSEPTKATSTAADQAAVTPPITPKTIATTDLEKLKWIEGTWRGTGDVTSPFFERYRFEGDSVLVMEELADETSGTVNETTRYELKNGQFGSDRSVATEFDDQSVTFSPLISGRNSFRWQTESKDVWKAILTLPATPSTPKRETVYRMERIG